MPLALALLAAALSVRAGVHSPAAARAPMTRALDAHLGAIAGALPALGTPIDAARGDMLAGAMLAAFAAPPSPGAGAAAAALLVQAAARPALIPALVKQVEHSRAAEPDAAERVIPRLESLGRVLASQEARGRLAAAVLPLTSKLATTRETSDALKAFFDGSDELPDRPAPAPVKAAAPAVSAAAPGASEFAAALAAATSIEEDPAVLESQVRAALARRPLGLGAADAAKVEEGLVRMFTKRAELMLFDKTEYKVLEDAGSGQTVALQQLHRFLGATLSRFQQDGLFDVYREVEKLHRLSGDEGREEALERFKRSLTLKHPHIRLIGSRSATAEKIDAARQLLELIPDDVLGSELAKRRLRGGIDLSAPRDQATRIGHYDEEKGLLGVQPTIFSKRQFIETFLHELGHAFEPLALEDPDFLALVERMKGKRYAVAALGGSAASRAAYVGALNELFAETFMHYILHGEELASGFEGRAADSAVWKDVYRFYRDKVFAKARFRAWNGRLRPQRAAEPASGVPAP